MDISAIAEALGADAIVAEGSESGGMQGFKGASNGIWELIEEETFIVKEKLKKKD